MEKNNKKTLTMDKFGRRQIDDSFLILFCGDNLHEVSYFLGKTKKYTSKYRLKFLPSMQSVKAILHSCNRALTL